MSYRQRENLPLLAVVSTTTTILLGFWIGFYRRVTTTGVANRNDRAETHGRIKRRLPNTQAEAKCLQPLDLPCGLLLQNRILRAAAFGGSDIESLLQSHVEVARGGVAMTTVAYAAVSRDGMTFANQLLLDHDDHKMLKDLQRLAKAVHKAGSKLSIQLAHAGSFADRKITKTQQLAPSRVFNPAGFDFAREMTLQDMDRVAADYVNAAKMAQRAGCDAIELHCGHGYLLSQFLSPKTNPRTDAFGGKHIDNRLRFPLRVLHDIRQAVGPRFAILVKMNLSDGFHGGLTPEDAQIAAIEFAKASADALVLSGGFTSRNGFYMLRGKTPYWSMARALGGTKGLAVLLFGWWLVPQIRFEECFFLEEARHVLQALVAASSNVPVCLVGGVVSLSAIEGCLDEGFELVQMARALIQNPNMVNDIRQSLPTTSVSIATTHHEKNGHDLNTTTRPDTTLQNDNDKNTNAKKNILSGCTHCNECVISTLDASRGMHCPIKDQRSDVSNTHLSW